MRKKTDDLVSGVRGQIDFLAGLGVDFVVPPGVREEEPARSRSPRQSPQADSELYGSLRDEILQCRSCPLCESRTHVVPGEGDIQADLMFVGEGPGHDEDVQGRPFVGRAGQLLTKIIAAMKYERPEVYITNVVKCRPPENRVPHGEEIEACFPFLLRQIEIVRPKVIVTLGKVAADVFVPNTSAMTLLRGRFYDFRGIRVRPTFHPAYLIRNEGNRELKRMVWIDMQEVMAVLGKK